MSLLLLLVGASSATPDTHDGIGDWAKYREYQKRVAKQRAKLLETEKQDQQRKLELRKELTRLYKGLPEEEVKTVLVAKEPEKKIKQQNFDGMIDILAALSKNIADIQEYRGILARETLRREQEDEDEMESLLMVIL